MGPSLIFCSHSSSQIKTAGVFLAISRANVVLPEPTFPQTKCNVDLLIAPESIRLTKSTQFGSAFGPLGGLVRMLADACVGVEWWGLSRYKRTCPAHGAAHLRRAVGEEEDRPLGAGYPETVGTHIAGNRRASRGRKDDSDAATTALWCRPTNSVDSRTRYDRRPSVSRSPKGLPPAQPRLIPGELFLRHL